MRRLTWLREEINRREANPSEDLKYRYIAQSGLKGQTVFIYWDCNPVVNKVIPIFNCDGTITVCQVAGTNTKDQDTKIMEQLLELATNRILSVNGNPDLPVLEKVKQRIIQNDSVSEGIIKEANNYDAVMVGAVGTSVYSKSLFGGIPLQIAKDLDNTVIVVKHFDRVRALVGRIVGE